MTPFQQPPLADDARRLFDVASAEADRLGHEYIGTEHVVLAVAESDAPLARALGHADVSVPHVIDGIMREGKSIGAQVLMHCGLTPARAAEFAGRGTLPGR